MDPEMINGLSKQILSTLNAMGKSKNIDEKLKYSQMTKNLCDSLGVFLNLASNFDRNYEDFEEEEFDDEFDEDEDNNSSDIPF